MNNKPVSNGTITPDPYGAVVERAGDHTRVVEYNGLEADDFVSRALENLEQGYGCVPIGRVDPHRPDLSPHKVAWCRGYHGYNARDMTADEIAAMPARIIRRLVRCERGLLNLGARMPVGLVGEDRDNYGGKCGLTTIAEHERRLGRRAPTYFVTARGFGSGSGIYLYGGVPGRWVGVGKLQGGGVDSIQPHLRYLAAPGSLHHSGATYQLYHEASGPQPLGFVLPAPDDPDLAPYPGNWLEALSRKSRRRGAPAGHALANSDDVAAFAEEHIFSEHPDQLAKSLSDVRNASAEGATRNPYHRALWIAARKARAGCYPWVWAVEQIEAVAREGYEARGKSFDDYEFARSVKHAVAEALDLTPAETASWGGGQPMRLPGVRGPARPRAPRRAIR